LRNAESQEARHVANGEPVSATHLVLIPSYNPGSRGLTTLLEARRHWNPVWIVVDGSDDGSREAFEVAAAQDSGIRVLVMERNRGKGAAVLHGLRLARAAGFTHALTMDSDGQHPADRIGVFMAASMAQPDAMILGAPQFSRDAPRIRVLGRKLSNFWVDVETLFMGVPDSLFGFRVYPIAPLVELMHARAWMQRFDFDAEAAVRLCWRGVRPVALPATVRYFRRDQGGVSHFRYLRDNLLLTWMHMRLAAGFLMRLPLLLARRLSFL
jgi:glycosyltransferase involved in cell wall biosynthesis